MTVTILAIAPYEELNQSIEAVSKQFDNTQVDVYTADLEEGMQIALERYSRYDAIISRGGTAELIRQNVPIPVIDISISIYDVLTAIRLASGYTDKFAIVAYESINEKAHLICDILGYNTPIITIHNQLETEAVLDTLKADGVTCVLCDVITKQVALSKSLDSILITSGFESIHHALNEATTISNYLQQSKQELTLYQEVLKSQNKVTLILDEQHTIVFQSAESDLVQSVLQYLNNKKMIAHNDHYYHHYKQHIYHIYTKIITAHQQTYYEFTIQKSQLSLSNYKTGFTYQSKHEIQEEIAKQLLFTKFITNDTLLELQKIKTHYQSLIIFGEKGTAKTNIAKQLFIKQPLNNRHLITLNAALLNEKLWKYLTSTNSPIFEEKNTLMIENIEQLNNYDFERLIALIKDSHFLRRNHLIFLYHTNIATNNQYYQELITQFRCLTLHSSSLRERQQELSSIITLLLNKMNIEFNTNILGFEPQALQQFLNYNWPGNFNQLQLALKTLMINANSHYITTHQVFQLLNKEMIAQEISQQSTINTLPTLNGQPTLEDYTRAIIQMTMEQNQNNQSKTAKQLGISRTTLWRYLKE